MNALWRLLGRAAALRFLAPAWRPVAFLALGMAAGAGLFVLHVSRAASYLSDAPETCANCHSPQECMRALLAATDLAGQCRVECARILARHGVTASVEYPDFDTKAKAQTIIKQFIDGKPPELRTRETR